DAADGATFPTLDPASGRVLADVALAGEKDVDRAVASARTAASAWRDIPPRARGRVLLRLADLMEEHGDELQLTEPLDIGKPIRYTGRVDLTQATTTMRFYGEAI